VLLQLCLSMGSFSNAREDIVCTLLTEEKILVLKHEYYVLHDPNILWINMNICTSMILHDL
jgi:hypothetical protein